MANRHISKIAMNDKRTLVHYKSYHNLDDGDFRTNDVPLKSDIRPHKDFYEAFQGIKKHIVPIMGLGLFSNQTDADERARHIITTVNIYEGDEDTSIKVSLQRYHKNGMSFNCTSWLINLNHYEYEKIKQLRKDVEALVHEAELYATGKKNGEDQLTLNFEAA